MTQAHFAQAIARLGAPCRVVKGELAGNTPTFGLHASGFTFLNMFKKLLDKPGIREYCAETERVQISAGGRK
jgi:hypothetical protein